MPSPLVDREEVQRTDADPWVCCLHGVREATAKGLDLTKVPTNCDAHPRTEPVREVVPEEPRKVNAEPMRGSREEFPPRFSRAWGRDKYGPAADPMPGSDWREDR